MSTIHNVKVVIYSILMCLLLSGCNDFVVNFNIQGKQIKSQPGKYGYFVFSNTEIGRLELKYKGKKCSIYYLSQNMDKSLAALKVGCIPFTSYLVINKSKKVRVPRRYIIIISGNKIVYQKESLTATFMKWIDNKHLEITYPHQKVVINQDGKEIKKADYKENLLKLIPSEEIH